MDDKTYEEVIPTKEIGVTGEILKKNLQKTLENHKVTITVDQMSILNILLIKDKITMQEISDKNHRDNSATTRIVDILERKGYVQRQRSDKDRRVCLIKLTSEGKKEVIKAKKTGKTYTNEVIKGVNAKELEIAMKVIKKIRQNALKFGN